MIGKKTKPKSNLFFVTIIFVGVRNPNVERLVGEDDLFGYGENEELELVHTKKTQNILLANKEKRKKM